MTATVNGISRATAIDLLVRADKRWATRHHDDPARGDYLEHLAAAIKPLIDPTTPINLDAHFNDGSPSKNDAELERQLTEIRDERDTARTQLDDANVDNARLADEIAALRQQLEQLRAENTALVEERAQLAEVADQPHICQWDWSDPTQPIQPCACGRTWPRYLEYEEEEIEPDVEPWDTVFQQLRDQLSDWQVPRSEEVQ